MILKNIHKKPMVIFLFQNAAFSVYLIILYKEHEIRNFDDVKYYRVIGSKITHMP